MGKTTIFESNVSISGGSNVITIPKYYIRANVVNPNKRYKVILEEVGEKI